MIRKYLEEDFVGIKMITQDYWKKEVEMNKELEDFIYDFLVRYYLCNRDLTFVAVDDNIVKAFLIASKLEDTNDAMMIWNEQIKLLSKKNQVKAKVYLDYLNYNHQKVLDHMSDKSIYLGLIASIKPHTGEQLIFKLKKEGLKKGMKNIYLWTDETCYYQYYEKRNFKLIETYYANLYDKSLKTFIYRLDI